jgi:hypothetical protein
MARYTVEHGIAHGDELCRHATKEGAERCAEKATSALSTWLKGLCLGYCHRGEWAVVKLDPAAALAAVATPRTVVQRPPGMPALPAGGAVIPSPLNLPRGPKARA